MSTNHTRLVGVCLFLFSSFLAFSQSRITGQIVVDNGEPGEFVNVLLLSAVDSNLIKMELSEHSGNYAFRGVEAGDYYIKITGIGYADFMSEPFIHDGNTEKIVSLITIEGLAEVLDAVEVVARKPLLEQRAGKLVVNVEDNITGQGGSVTDLLKKVPGLVVVNDKVSMAGRSGVTILIDGRPTKYMDIESLLREMPADNIARIEVISQPGAAYDAEGTGGVINIVLKRNRLQGTNGSVYAGGGYGELAKYRAGLRLNHRTGPWNLSMSTGFNHRSWVEKLDLERVIGDSVYRQKNNEPGEPNSFYLNLGADYDINASHRVGITANGYRSAREQIGENQTRIINSEGSLLEDWVTTNTEDRSWRSLTADAYYRWEIDTTGQKITLDANLADYRRRMTGVMETTGFDFPTRRTKQPADTRIYAAQMDYELPFKSNWKFETGAKISKTMLENEQDSRYMISGEWVIDELVTNDFEYNEEIYAAYTSLSYTKGEWDANLGLRYENSQAIGFSRTLDSTTVLDIAKVFPSFSMSTPFFGPLGTAVSYSYRIERPSYFDLNPFQYFLDPLTSSKGNPFLKPELTHSAQFSLTYEKQPFFNLSYDLTNDALTEVIEQDDQTGEAFKTDVNLDKYIRYGGSLFFPLDFMAKSISGYGGVMLFYHDYQAEYLGTDYLKNQWTTNAFMQVNVSLPADWKLEVTGWLQGAGLDGIIQYETFYGVDAGIQKKFLDNKLSVQLSADGIVQKFFKGKVDYANLNFNIHSRWEAPTFQARVTYKFGNQHLKGRENRKSSSDTERQRAEGS